MTSPTKLTWCAMLAKLVAPMHPEQAAKAFCDMLPLLPADDDRYTKSALERAARIDRKTAVPTYDDLARAFAEEWRENLPAHVRLGGQPDALKISDQFVPSSAAEIAKSLAAWKIVKAENAAKTSAENPVPSIKTAHLTKIQLALGSDQKMLAMRPDLRMAMQMANEASAARTKSLIPGSHSKNP